MKKLFTLVTLFCSLGMSTAISQILVSQNISKGGIDLTDNTVVGQVTINPATSGKVIVHFDGNCISDVGDMIVLAASNTTSWGINDGNVSVEAVDANVNSNSFSHTRVYDVSAGSHTYYAVAQNYVKTAGSGIASIYGTLTAEFIPDGASLVGFDGISKTSIDLTNSTVVGQVTINPATSGKVIVHFDGNCISDVGDRIVLAASNTTSWGVDDGNVSVEAVSTDLNSNCFSHTRVYDVTAGSQTYYAVAQNYVETAGSGIASVYGSLTVEFIPDGASTVGFQGISSTNTDLSSSTVVGQVTVDPATSGKVIVHFDGKCISDVGDRIVLAASNTTSWGTDDGNVAVEAASADLNSNCFSHTRVYDVTAGSYTYYAVAQNYVETAGSGIASIYGSLTAMFVPESTTDVVDNDFNKSSLNIYPNPVKDNSIFIEYAQYENSNVEIINSNGQLMKSLSLQGPKTKVNIENLSRGMYFIKITNGSRVNTKKFIRE